MAWFALGGGSGLAAFLIASGKGAERGDDLDETSDRDA
jgi:hypothetical protein